MMVVLYNIRVYLLSKFNDEKADRYQRLSANEYLSKKAPDWEPLADIGQTC